MSSIRSAGLLLLFEAATFIMASAIHFGAFSKATDTRKPELPRQ